MKKEENTKVEDQEVKNAEESSDNDEMIVVDKTKEEKKPLSTRAKCILVALGVAALAGTVAVVKCLLTKDEDDEDEEDDDEDYIDLDDDDVEITDF